MTTDFATLPVPEAHHGHGTPAEALRRVRVGIVLFILADVMLVLAFALSQVYLSALNTDHAFLPADVHPPSAMPGLAVVALGAFGALVMAGNIRSPQLVQAQTRSRGLLGLVIFAVALVLEVYLLSTLGFGASAGAYASSFYVLNALAALHLGTAALGSLFVVGRASGGRLTVPRARAGIEFASWWAIWVAVAGLIMWGITSFVV